MNQVRSARFLWLVILTAVLTVHFESRLSAQLARPLDERHFYPSSYLVSLSLLSGRGFNYLLPARLAPAASLTATILQHRRDPDATGPVMDFLSGQGRNSLSAREWQGYLASGTQALSIAPGHVFVDGGWEVSRILDIHVAAALWRIFGIAWSIVFAFYALLSTAACLLVFFITSRLTGSAWGGILGAASFMASPLERDAGAWSIRDASPLWFTCLALFLLLKYGQPGGARVRDCLGWLAVGAGSIVGLGWRGDALALPPFAFVALLLMLAAARTSLAPASLAVACFLSGMLGMYATIGWLGPDSPEKASNPAFHMAWYGDNARSNRLRTENVFQVRASDSLVLYQANYWRVQSRHGEPYASVYDQRHSTATRAMYSEMLRYHLYSWWTRFPSYLAGLAHIDQALVPDPPIGGRTSRAATWLARAWELSVGGYLGAMPWLFALGIVLGVLRLPGRVATTVLATYFAYYGAALLAVLPEEKHYAALLLPLHALSAAGCWHALSCVRSRIQLLSPRGLVQRIRGPALAASVLLVWWGFCGLFAYSVSRAQRRRFVDSVMALTAMAQEPAQSPQTPYLHTVSVPSKDAGEPWGYLFKVRGARRSVDLYCLHARDGNNQEPLYYSTRHGLAANREQFFFVNPVAGTRIGEARDYTLYVGVRGGPELLSVTRLSLSGWDLALPLSFVFMGEDDPIGGWSTPAPTEAFNSLREAESLVRRRSSPAKTGPP